MTAHDTTRCSDGMVWSSGCGDVEYGDVCKDPYLVLALFPVCCGCCAWQTGSEDVW